MNLCSCKHRPLLLSVRTTVTSRRLPLTSWRTSSRPKPSPPGRSACLTSAMSAWYGSTASLACFVFLTLASRGTAAICPQEASKSHFCFQIIQGDLAQRNKNCHSNRIKNRSFGWIRCSGRLLHSQRLWAFFLRQQKTNMWAEVRSCFVNLSLDTRMDVISSSCLVLMRLWLNCRRC